MIIFKSLEIVPAVEVERKPTVNWGELREKEASKAAESQLKEIQSINKDMIKPNYIEDKSVAYKSSGYVRD